MADLTLAFRFLTPGSTADELSIRLYERIYDASLMGLGEDGSFLLEFDRRSDSLSAALASAWRELVEALPDVEVLRVEEDNLATKQGSVQLLSWPELAMAWRDDCVRQ